MIQRLFRVNSAWWAFPSGNSNVREQRVRQRVVRVDHVLGARRVVHVELDPAAVPVGHEQRPGPADLLHDHVVEERALEVAVRDHALARDVVVVGVDLGHQRRVRRVGDLHDVDVFELEVVGHHGERPLLLLPREDAVDVVVLVRATCVAEVRIAGVICELNRGERVGDVPDREAAVARLRIADLVVADEDLALEVLGVEIDDVGALARERPIGPVDEPDLGGIGRIRDVDHREARVVTALRVAHREVRVVPVRGHVGHAIGCHAVDVHLTEERHILARAGKVISGLAVLHALHGVDLGRRVRESRRRSP